MNIIVLVEEQILDREEFQEGLFLNETNVAQILWEKLRGIYFV